MANVSHVASRGKVRLDKVIDCDKTAAAIGQ